MAFRLGLHAPLNVLSCRISAENNGVENSMACIVLTGTLNMQLNEAGLWIRPTGTKKALPNMKTRRTRIRAPVPGGG